MMKIYLCIVFFLLNAVESFSQTRYDELKMAEELYRNERYSDAVPIFLKLLQKDSLNAELNFKIGICYLNSRSQKNKSVNYLKHSVLPNNLSILPMNAYEFLGDSYQLNQLFELAIEAYEKHKIILLSKDHKYSDDMARIKWKIEMCGISKKITEGQEKYNYNSSFSSDQSELTFTFYKQNTDHTDAYFHDFHISDNSEPLNSSNDTTKIAAQNEATVGTSTDAQHILLYRNDEGSCNLYVSSLNGNKWSTPHKLDKKINDTGWESGEFVSADNTTLYFTSDRKGGFGGKDIYKCERNSAGAWGKATNLGSEINTAYDEEAPFIHPTDKILYFSSNRYTHSTGFDIFSSCFLNDGTWTRPENVGYPSKTIKDENNTSSPAIDQQSNGVITFTDQAENRITILTGLAADPSGTVPGNIKITISDNNTGEISGRYNSKNEFSFILPEDINTNITYESPGYLFFSENIDLSKGKTVFSNKKVRSFTPFMPGSVIELNNIFFEKDNSRLLQSSGRELSKLVQLLSAENNLVAELSAYIDSDENKKYNSRLSQERVRVIIEYLISKGINKDKLSAKNYGKSIRVFSKTESSKKNVIYSGDQKIEFKIIEIDTKKNNSITTQ